MASAWPLKPETQAPAALLVWGRTKKEVRIAWARTWLLKGRLSSGRGEASWELPASVLDWKEVSVQRGTRSKAWPGWKECAKPLLCSLLESTARGSWSYKAGRTTYKVRKESFRMPVSESRFWGTGRWGRHRLRPASGTAAGCSVPLLPQTVRSPARWEKQEA